MGIIDFVKDLIDEGIKPKLVSKEIREERMMICKNCPKYLDATAQCGACLCFLNVKTWLYYDPIEQIKKGSSEPIKAACPLKHW